MQKNKLNILSTRPLNEEIIDKAETQNIFIDPISFIETEPLKSAALEDEIEQLSCKKITAVFTSMNAVEAVKDCLSSGPAWKIFSIGEATKNLIDDFFGSESIIATADDANHLADAIIEKGVKEIVFFCGTDRRNELPEKLKAANIKVNEIVVYRTILTAKNISKHYDGIMFFSPSAVRSFFSANKVSDDAVVFAIGNTTADTVKQFVQNKIIVADRPGKEALVEQMIAYFRKQKQAH